MARSPRQRNLRGQGALLRDEILCAAIRVIDAAQTEAEVSLRGIAREAGISTMSVYGHFANRDELLAAVAEMSWGQVCEEITQQSQAGATVKARLVLGCEAYVAFAQRYPLRYALMTQVDETPQAARQALAVLTRGLLACGVASGGDPQAPSEVGPEVEPDAESHRTASALSVALHGVAMLHRSDKPHLWLSDFSTREIIGSLIDAAILQLERASDNETASDPER